MSCVAKTRDGTHLILPADPKAGLAYAIREVRSIPQLRSVGGAQPPTSLSVRDARRSLPILYFSMRLIRAGAWNAYLLVLLPGRLPQLGRGRAALVTERDQVPVRHGCRGGALGEPVPRTLG
jgi:hypothetical protein